MMMMMLLLLLMMMMILLVLLLMTMTMTMMRVGLRRFVNRYSGGNPSDPSFKNLIVRWFQFGAFCPLFRLHGAYWRVFMIVTSSAGQQ